MKARELWEKSVYKNKSVEDELNQAFELASEAAETTESEKDILRGIVNFGTLSVKQVMRTRTEIDAINTDLNFDELIVAVNSSGFSRIPVFNKTIDAIEGVLYTKDLLPFLGYPSNFVWHQLIRPPFVVTETKKIDLLLKDFQEKRVHVAIVRDEKGNTSGLVTLEDLIEEIIGDINDEFDEVDTTLQNTQDGIQHSDRKNTTVDSLVTHDMDPERFNQAGIRHHRTSHETENQPREGGHV
jgi:CBS domain containing-hemolysin-like protein